MAIASSAASCGATGLRGRRFRGDPLQPDFPPEEVVVPWAVSRAMSLARHAVQDHRVAQGDHLSGLFGNDLRDRGAHPVTPPAVLQHFRIEPQAAILGLGVERRLDLLAALDLHPLAGRQVQRLARRPDLVPAGIPAEQPAEGKADPPADAAEGFGERRVAEDLAQAVDGVPPGKGRGGPGQLRGLAVVAAVTDHGQLFEVRARRGGRGDRVAAGAGSRLQPGRLPEDPAAALAAVVVRAVAAQTFEEHGILQAAETGPFHAGQLRVPQDAKSPAAIAGHFRHEGHAVELAAGVKRGEDFAGAADLDHLAPAEGRVPVTIVDP